MKKAFAISAIIVFSAFQTSQAQSDWKNWNAINLTVSPSKKLDIRLSHLRSYELSNKYNNNFNQSSAQAEYTIKRITATGGIMLTQFPASAASTTREYLRLSYKLPVAGVLNFSNSIQGELHSATEKRFKYRLIYITRIGLQKRLPFLRLAPSVSYWLYYNMGGQPIQYYNEAGAKLVKQTPDGLHRGRFFFNLNSKVTKFFSVNLYFMRQSEFNLFTNELRAINVKNPVTGNVTRAFDAYNTAGISLAFDLNLFKKN
jgi:hypothetical protein